MKNTNEIRPVNDTKIYLSDLREGEKFQIPSMALPSGHKRTYIYIQHTKSKTLVFPSSDGNGELKLTEQFQFKLQVERV